MSRCVDSYLYCSESFQTLPGTMSVIPHDVSVVETAWSIPLLKQQTIELVVNMNALLVQQCESIPCERHGHASCLCHQEFKAAAASLYTAAQRVLQFIHTREACAAEAVAPYTPTPPSPELFDEIPLVDLEDPAAVQCPACDQYHHGDYLCQSCYASLNAFL